MVGGGKPRGTGGRLVGGMWAWEPTWGGKMTHVKNWVKTSNRGVGNQGQLIFRRLRQFLPQSTNLKPKLYRMKR